MKRKGLLLNGWVVLDKPAGLTSTQALGKVRWLLNAAKAGHGGTLDPMATGILPLAFGEATKTIGWIMDATKEYTFTAKWGESRVSDDAEGALVATSDVRPTRAAIEAALPQFQGRIIQKPPAVSALKIDGQRAYDLVREGVEVDLAPREVNIISFTLDEILSDDEASFKVTCGKGTYMRALARDLALAVGTLGHITALRRLRVGPFALADATTLEALTAQAPNVPAETLLLPLERALEGIPSLVVTEAEAARLRCGQPVSLLASHNAERLRTLPDAARTGAIPVIALTDSGKAQAIADIVAGELRVARLIHY